MERKLWKVLYQIVKKMSNRWGAWRYSTGEIVGVYLWSVANDRPMVWALDPANWPDDVRPVGLPSQSTLSRRLRHADAVDLMTAVEQQWMILLAIGRRLIRVIDGKALPISKISKDADIGYGRGAGEFQTGYKLHAVWDGGPLPIAWALAPMNTSEKKMAKALIPTLPGGGYLLGDNQYDANPLYDLAGQSGFQLVAPPPRSRGRGGLGHRRQSPYRLRCLELLKTRFGRALFHQRGLIERKFGNLTSCGSGLAPLPAWVRRFTRVRNWVHAKLLIHAARWFVKHSTTQIALA
jgi:Transposase DDE domain